MKRYIIILAAVLFLAAGNAVLGDLTAPPRGPGDMDKISSDSQRITDPRYRILIKDLDKSPFPAVNPETDTVEIVYAARTTVGSDYEIFHTYWDDYLNEWMPPVQITNNAVDDLDPRLDFGSNGIKYCVWWSDEQVPGVYLSGQPSEGSYWTEPSLISPPGLESRHPNMVIYEGLINIFYESENPGNGTSGSSRVKVGLVCKTEGIPLIVD